MGYELVILAYLGVNSLVMLTVIGFHVILAIKFLSEIYFAFYFCSPEHPSLRTRGRSMLSGDRKSFRDFTDDMPKSRF